MGEMMSKSGDSTCWSGNHWGFVTLSVFNMLMMIVIVILLWVVDLQTNQIADTALLALMFIFQGVLWWMACPCGTTEADGKCTKAGGGENEESIRDGGGLNYDEIMYNKSRWDPNQ